MAALSNAREKNRLRPVAKSRRTAAKRIDWIGHLMGLLFIAVWFGLLALGQWLCQLVSP